MQRLSAYALLFVVMAAMFGLGMLIGSAFFVL